MSVLLPPPNRVGYFMSSLPDANPLHSHIGPCYNTYIRWTAWSTRQGKASGGIPSSLPIQRFLTMGNTNLSGGLVTQQFVKTYTTFSGVDITALFDDMTLMTLQGIAVSITREKVPVYVSGTEFSMMLSRRMFCVIGCKRIVSPIIGLANYPFLCMFRQWCMKNA